MTGKPGEIVETDRDFNCINCGRSCLGMNTQLSTETPVMRQFGTGATRNTDAGKLDFEGFLSPLALKRFAEYMHRHRQQADGKLRDSDNWQKGIPVEAYMKSAWRHFFAVWETYRRTGTPDQEDLCALLFNVQGLIHESIKKGVPAP